MICARSLMPDSTKWRVYDHALKVYRFDVHAVCPATARLWTLNRQAVGLCPKCGVDPYTAVEQRRRVLVLPWARLVAVDLPLGETWDPAVLERARAVMERFPSSGVTVVKQP